MDKLDRAECMRRLRDEGETLLAAVTEEKRSEYVSWLRGAFSQKQLGVFTARMEEMLARYSTPEQRADAARMDWLRTDLLFCYFYYGCDFDEYFIYHFERKTHRQRSQYITQNRREAWYKKFNRKDLQILFDDKTRTYDTYKKYFRRECFALRTAADEEGFLAFCARHPVFFVKDAMGYCGRGIGRVEREALGDLRAYFRELLKSAPLLIEEPIRQGEALAALHPSSVNTIRTITVADRQGGIHTIECCIRMGRGGSVVDNYSAGGLYCVVDPDSGLVVTDGLDKRCVPCACHPDTGVRFRGFRMPAWDAFKALVAELVRVVPEVRLVGWDLAWTEDGWALVEANQCAELGGQEDLGCGFLPIFEALL